MQHRLKLAGVLNKLTSVQNMLTATEFANELSGTTRNNFDATTVLAIDRDLRHSNELCRSENTSQRFSLADRKQRAPLNGQKKHRQVQFSRSSCGLRRRFETWKNGTPSCLAKLLPDRMDLP